VASTKPLNIIIPFLLENMSVQSTEDDFLSRSEVTAFEWFPIMNEWVSIAFKFDKVTALITGIMLEHYSYASAYKSNRKTISSVILYCLPNEDIDTMEKSDLLKRKKRTPEEELWKKREKIIKIKHLYNRLGIETYGKDNFVTSLPTTEKKKGKPYLYQRLSHFNIFCYSESFL
jgi:hypothetical protein